METVEERVKGEVDGKSRVTFYISDDLLDILDEYWRNQPRDDRTSKSLIVETAVEKWLRYKRYIDE